jgi:hypothetical protein
MRRLLQEDFNDLRPRNPFHDESDKEMDDSTRLPNISPGGDDSDTEQVLPAQCQMNGSDKSKLKPLWVSGSTPRGISSMAGTAQALVARASGRNTAPKMQYQNVVQPEPVLDARYGAQGLNAIHTQPQGNQQVQAHILQGVAALGARVKSDNIQRTDESQGLASNVQINPSIIVQNGTAQLPINGGTLISQHVISTQMKPSLLLNGTGKHDVVRDIPPTAKPTKELTLYHTSPWHKYVPFLPRFSFVQNSLCFSFVRL